MSEETPAVRLDGVTKRFGDVVANDEVDLTLERGSVRALVGENGAGKTTLMSVLYGLYQPDAGQVIVDGTPQSFDSPRDAIDAGIGMIHQHFMLVEPMTVTQNVVLGHEPARAGFVDVDAARDRIRELSDRYGFDIAQHLDTPVGQLGVGTRQRVEILKSLYRGADVLILDEPTAVLTPQEVERLYEVMGQLTDQGHALVFITHKLDEAMRAADQITVLRDGRAVGTVDADTTDRAELARLMVGRDVLFDLADRPATTGDPVLEVSGLEATDDRGIETVSGVDLTVREGEILGIAGVEGNGQTELVETVTGLRRADAGTIRFNGTDISAQPRRRRIESGIAYIPEDRQTEGLVMEYDLVENALLGNQTGPEFIDRGFLDWSAVRDHAERIIEEYDVQPKDADAVAASLSGGNQQKFVVGREFEHEPDLMVAAQPTRGVDVGSIEFIHDRLLELRAEGTAILLVSSKLDEVRKLSDRLAVMYEGRIVDTVDPDDVSERELGLLMAGDDPSERAAPEEPSERQPAPDGGDPA